jgi:hypothetical protein
MSATGRDVFDKSLQTTNIWLVGLDRQIAWHVLGASLRAPRDQRWRGQRGGISSNLGRAGSRWSQV